MRVAPLRRRGGAFFYRSATILSRALHFEHKVKSGLVPNDPLLIGKRQVFPKKADVESRCSAISVAVGDVVTDSCQCLERDRGFRRPRPLQASSASISSTVGRLLFNPSGSRSARPDCHSATPIGLSMLRRAYSTSKCRFDRHRTRPIPTADSQPQRANRGNLATAGGQIGRPAD